MTKVYSSPDRMLVDTFRRVLESYGIQSDARAGASSGGRKKTPLTGLWVLDDNKADQARNIIAQAEKKGPQSTARWKCANCREVVEGPYDQCWHCGARRTKRNA